MFYHHSGGNLSIRLCRYHVVTTLQLRYDYVTTLRHVTTLLLSSSVSLLPNMFIYGLLCCLYMLIRIIVVILYFFLLFRDLSYFSDRTYVLYTFCIIFTFFCVYKLCFICNLFIYLIAPLSSEVHSNCLTKVVEQLYIVHNYFEY